MIRVVVVGAIVIAIGVFLFSQYSRVSETSTGREGLVWGVIFILAIQLFFFMAYVAFAYTPIFKVIPKGEIYRPRNWGKTKRNKQAA